MALQWVEELKYPDYLEGSELRQKRLDSNLSLEHVAKNLGLSAEELAAIEIGKVRITKKAMKRCFEVVSWLTKTKTCNSARRVNFLIVVDSDEKA